ncbi:TolC family protein [Pseudobacteriovorax antillogorgiicola]|uniref:Outer membrane protein TolC n=1 Tax=Pseudobacteriovorax antillogorgiicola TaxID=1513793 RepID=A0A1Y6BP66_9BACT|nr:TolC family protein [Pseudobacteriovorax antillogorgiicola]TCS53801.1 outer membrane protein TolC [Pseudobacteriovorax antillogorgiicola]SMF22128.1 Outer membrane protein TolC [Pseudobacteriovorax antillogorgiicola]
MNPIRYLITAVIALSVTPSWAAPMELSESDIITLARKQNPTGKQIEALRKQGRLQSTLSHERYSTNLVSSANYTDTNEQALYPGAVVFGPTKTVSVGIQSNLGKGFSSKLAVSNDQRSTTDGLLKDFTSTNFEASLTMDLWKNFLGSLDQAEVERAFAEQQRNDIEAQIQQKSFEFELRKIYWALVANEQSQGLAKGLLKGAKRQLAETERRYRSSVADVADVARLRAQVVSRENVVKALAFQRTQLEQQLKTLLPELGSHDIALKSVKLDKIVADVMQCTVSIQSRDRDPLADTMYKESLALLDKQHRLDRTITETYDDIDLSLTGAYTVLGRADAYDESFKNVYDQPINGFSIALSLTMPLDQSKTRSKLARLSLEESVYQAERQKLVAQLAAQKQSIGPQIKILYETIEHQKRNTQLLKKSSIAIEKQYRQARISIMELINEQDSLQDSQLKEVDAYLLVVNTLLDYLRTFNQTPCPLNA